MIKQYIIAIGLVSLVGCGPGEVTINRGPTGPQGPQGTQGTPGLDAPVPVAPIVDPLQANIDSLVSEENEYRQSSGDTELTSGLKCILYTTTGGDRIQSSISGHNTLTGLTQVGAYRYSGDFNQPDSPATDGMNVLPSALRAVYKNMYMLRCTGYVVLTESKVTWFDLSTDDAGVFYVDGSKLIDNDNAHGITTVSASKQIRKGVHAFRVDYAQTGAGNQALILKMDGLTIDSRRYFH